VAACLIAMLLVACGTGSDDTAAVDGLVVALILGQVPLEIARGVSDCTVTHVAGGTYRADCGFKFVVNIETLTVAPADPLTKRRWDQFRD
jgi:hypothetical protein